MGSTGRNRSSGQKHLVFVAVICVAACVFGCCDAYDYFTLALQWPFSFCHDATAASCTAQLKTDLQDFNYFTIHGLWPSNIKGDDPRNCDTRGLSVTKAIAEPLKPCLMHFWPRLFSPKSFDKSLKLWNDQWTTHGACAFNDPAKYVTATLDLGQKYSTDVFYNLAKAGIVPVGAKTKLYPTNKFNEAIKKATGGKSVQLICQKAREDSNVIVLTEIRLCFEKDTTKTRDCGKTSTCTKSFALPDSSSVLVYLDSLRNSSSSSWAL